LVTASRISRALSTCVTFTPAGSGMVTGPETSVTSAPSRARCGGDGVALFAGRAVGDVAHRIDRLVRRARRDDDPSARERLRRPSIEQCLDAGDDLQRFGHAPVAGLARFRHLAGYRVRRGECRHF
jgi:hypothetical protein